MSLEAPNDSRLRYALSFSIFRSNSQTDVVVNIENAGSGGISGTMVGLQQ